MNNTRGRSLLVAIFVGIAMHILFWIGSIKPLSMTTPGEPDASRISIVIVLFFCSLTVDALVAVYYAVASYRKAPITAKEGAIGGAVSSLLARVFIGGLGFCFAIFGGIYEVMNTGDAPLSQAHLSANPTLGLVLAAGAPGAGYALSLVLLPITMPVAALSGAICVNLLRRSKAPNK